MPNSQAASKIQTMLQEMTDWVRYGKRVAEWEFDVPSAVVLTERAWPIKGVHLTHRWRPDARSGI